MDCRKHMRPLNSPHRLRIFLLIVGLAVSGHLPALAISGPPLRTGLWVMQAIVGEKAENLEAQVRANPRVSGVCLHIGWKDIEKQPGQFDFSAIDKAVAVLRRIGMKYEDLHLSFFERIIDYGVSKYAEHFTIQNCQLTGGEKTLAH